MPHELTYNILIKLNTIVTSTMLQQDGIFPKINKLNIINNIPLNAVERIALARKQNHIK